MLWVYNETILYYPIIYQIGVVIAIECKKIQSTLVDSLARLSSKKSEIYLI